MDGMQLPTAAALTARYGAGAEPKIGPWNDTMALLLSHRSVRGYRPDALPAGTLESLIAAAQSAATSSNLQTWSVAWASRRSLPGGDALPGNLPGCGN